MLPDENELHPEGIRAFHPQLHRVHGRLQPMRNNLSPGMCLIVALLFMLAFVALSPAERTLGTDVHLVHLRGAWAWSALVGLAVAVVLGIIGLAGRNVITQSWSPMRTMQVTHPPSPIFSSGSGTTKIYFTILLAAPLLAARQLTRLNHRLSADAP